MADIGGGKAAPDRSALPAIFPQPSFRIPHTLGAGIPPALEPVPEAPDNTKSAGRPLRPALLLCPITNRTATSSGRNRWIFCSAVAAAVIDWSVAAAATEACTELAARTNDSHDRTNRFFMPVSMDYRPLISAGATDFP